MLEIVSFCYFLLVHEIVFEEIHCLCDLNKLTLLRLINVNGICVYLCKVALEKYYQHYFMLPH